MGLHPTLHPFLTVPPSETPPPGSVVAQSVLPSLLLFCFSSRSGLINHGPQTMLLPISVSTILIGSCASHGCLCRGSGGAVRSLCSLAHSLGLLPSASLLWGLTGWTLCPSCSGVSRDGLSVPLALGSHGADPLFLTLTFPFSIYTGDSFVTL